MAVNNFVLLSIKECDMELDSTKRALAVTSAELANCVDMLSSAWMSEVQYVIDGVAVLLSLWGFARLVWDFNHRRRDLFPVDR